MSIGWMRRNAVEELSDSELLLLLDATNACRFSFGASEHVNEAQNAAIYLVASAEDAIKLDRLGTKWAVNADAFLAKLRRLTDLQAFEVLVRLDCAWRNHERVEDDDQWIATAFERPTLSTSDRANSNPNSPKGLDPLAGSGAFLAEAADRNDSRTESR
jgi:hypothetical protein